MGLFKAKRVWLGYELRNSTFVVIFAFESRDVALEWQGRSAGSRKVKAVTLITDEEVK